ncbi:class I SAM-dependent methyltransferase, partial [Patescibacteria group bacterium]|nr:class I SAM-dependent methyltransferase [Patescibacteria group bacterium]
EIFKELNLTEDSVMYDLGCGDGRVLFYCEERSLKVKCIGIDKALAARVVFVFKKIFFHKKSNVVFCHKNMFKHDLSDATHIFVYLFPGLMNSLFDKLKKELKPGAIVISCDFEFKDKKPSRIVNLNRSKHLLGQRLLIYEF